MTRRSAVLALAVCAALAAPAHAAPSWTAMTSNTTQDILALEYHGAGKAWFGTANGQIFQLTGSGWVQRSNNPGVSIYDIEFEPGGTIGLAVGTGGEVFRSADGGANWSPVALPPSNNDVCLEGQPVGDIRKVAFAKPGVAVLFGDMNQVLRSQPATASHVGAEGTWANINDAPNPDGCVQNYGAPITGAFFVPSASDVTGYLMKESFGGVYFIADNFGEIQEKGTGPNGFTTPHKLAGDPDNPNRQWAVAVAEGGNGSYFARTIDGWSNSLSWEEGNPTRRSRDSAQDIAFAGGTVLMVGDGGQIMNSVDGTTFYYVDDPANPTARWLATDLSDGGNAIVGGAGGKLIATGNANSIPDVLAPTGTINGPEAVPALSPTQYTAAVADEAGGSGINPAGFAWTATGLPGATGNPATITFPAEGTYFLRLSFRDNAGNVAEATKTVTVGKPVVAFPPTGSSGISAKRSGRSVRVRVKGRLTAPAGKSCAGKLRVIVKKKKRTLKKKTLRVRSSCRYKGAIKVRRSKVGKAKRLRVVLRFLGNSDIAPSRVSYSTKVR